MQSIIIPYSFIENVLVVMIYCYYYKSVLAGVHRQKFRFQLPIKSFDLRVKNWVNILRSPFLLMFIKKKILGLPTKIHGFPTLEMFKIPFLTSKRQKSPEIGNFSKPGLTDYLIPNSTPESIFPLTVLSWCIGYYLFFKYIWPQSTYFFFTQQSQVGIIKYTHNNIYY